MASSKATKTKSILQCHTRRQLLKTINANSTTNKWKLYLAGPYSNQCTRNIPPSRPLPVSVPPVDIATIFLRLARCSPRTVGWATRSSLTQWRHRSAEPQIWMEMTTVEEGSIIWALLATDAICLRWMELEVQRIILWLTYLRSHHLWPLLPGCMSKEISSDRLEIENYIKTFLSRIHY